MKKVYNKLVRDKIPDIVLSEGKNCEFNILLDSRFIEELEKKLLEEINEYLGSKQIEELADIEEVLRAILRAKNVSKSDFENIIKKKEKERGGFKKRIFLVSVDEHD